MDCPKCHQANPPETYYCGRCGTRLDSQNDPSFTRTLVTPPKELTRGTLFAGRYEIIEELGAGGMGRVYRVLDKKLNEEIALKIIKPEIAAEKRIVERFQNELKVARKITHKNVCRMHDLHEEGKTLYLTMEYVRGEDLKSLLHRTRALSVGTAVSIAHQIAEGLSEAHKLGITHRDLKPGNIMIDKDGQAKIMDFGIARVKQEKGITGEGAIIGTPEYMSPEQVEGKSADPRSDIYALGVILFEMLAGRPPFEGETPLSVAHKHRYEPPPVPKKLVPQIPEGLNRLILRSLEKDKAKRYQTTDELAADLVALKPSLPVSDRAALKPKTKTRTSHEITVKFTPRKLIIPAAGLLALIAVVGVWNFVLRAPAASAASVIVLPCQVNGSQEDKYLSEAIPRTISAELVGVEGLETKAPPTNAEFDSIGGSRDRIVSLYHVQRLVIPSISVKAGNFLLNVQLIDTRSKRLVWTKDYESGQSTYLVMTRTAAEDLRRVLRPASPQIGPPTGRPLNSEAELALQKGRYFLDLYDDFYRQADWDRALAECKRALELDPKLANAAGLIALLYEGRWEAGEAPQEAIPPITSWAQRALAIDPHCWMAWAGLEIAEAMKAHPDRRKVIEYSLKAGSFGPSDPKAVYVSGVQLVPTLALESSLAAHRLDALTLISGCNTAAQLFLLNRSGEGLPYLDEVLSIEPKHVAGLALRPLLLADLGRLGEASESLNQARAGVDQGGFFGPWVIFGQYALALQQGAAGPSEALFKSILSWMNDSKTAPFNMDNAPQLCLPFMARHGKIAEAFRFLERDAEAGCLLAYDLLVLDPRLEPLRRDARFTPILEKSRKEFEDMLAVFREARSRGEFPQYLEAPLDGLLEKLGMKI